MAKSGTWSKSLPFDHERKNEGDRFFVDFKSTHTISSFVGLLAVFVCSYEIWHDFVKQKFKTIVTLSLPSAGPIQTYFVGQCLHVVHLDPSLDYKKLDFIAFFITTVTYELFLPSLQCTTIIMIMFAEKLHLCLCYFIFIRTFSPAMISEV